MTGVHVSVTTIGAAAVVSSAVISSAVVSAAVVSRSLRRKEEREKCSCIKPRAGQTQLSNKEESMIVRVVGWRERKKKRVETTIFLLS